MRVFRNLTRVVLLALALTYGLAPGASADMLNSNTWTVGTLEDFTAYDPVDAGLPDPENISYVGKVLGQGSGGQRNCSRDPWDNWQLPQYRGYKDGGNNVVNLCPSSATYAQRAAWRGMTPAGVGDQYQRVSFMVKTAQTAASAYTAAIIASNNEALYYGNTNAIPAWDVSNLSLRPHVRTGLDYGADTGPEWIGPDVDISDGLWHTMDIVYDLTTGDAEWYKDGALVATLPDDPDLKGWYLGRTAKNFEFWQKNDNDGALQAGGTGNATTPGVLFDDVQTLSAVPEPVTLLLLGLGGLFGLRRRR